MAESKSDNFSLKINAHSEKISWLATQCRWSPALVIFPEQGILQGILQIRRFWRARTPNSDVGVGRLTQIPYSTEQGIISAELGILPLSRCRRG